MPQAANAIVAFHPGRAAAKSGAEQRLAERWQQLSGAGAWRLPAAGGAGWAYGRWGWLGTSCIAATCPVQSPPFPPCRPARPAGPVWPDRALKGVCLCRWDNPERPFPPPQQPPAPELLEAAEPLLLAAPAADGPGP